jgi:glycosyltransferase involved in cell wall biosynthesis
METPSIVAIIPAHNEATRVADVVSGALAHLPVILIDDGSTDGTDVAAEAAGATVVRQRANQGKGAALRVGFERALADGFDAVVTLDSDGQHDPAEIPQFLAAAIADPDLALVVGRRDFASMPLSRRVANELGGRAFSWAVGRPIPDNQSGYRLVTRRLMEATLGSRERGFEFEVEMIATAIRAGWAIGWVPIRTIYAGETSHIQSWRHLASFIRVVRAARRTVREGRS